MSPRMRVTRISVVWLLACLIVMTCSIVKSSRGFSKFGQFCFLWGNKSLSCPLAAAEPPRSFTLYPRTAEPVSVRRRPLSFLSQAAPFTVTITTRRLTELRGRIPPLLAASPFSAASDPGSTCDDFVPESLRDAGIQSGKCALSPTYVESNARYVRLSPIKTRRVVHELRGKNLAAALAHLASSPRRPALAIFRTIESAISNAVQLHGERNVKPQLVSVTATNGPVMKRPFFKARGRLNIWRRPTTHIKVILKAQ